MKNKNNSWVFSSLVFVRGNFQEIGIAVILSRLRYVMETLGEYRSRDVAASEEIKQYSTRFRRSQFYYVLRAI